MTSFALPAVAATSLWTPVSGGLSGAIVYGFASDSSGAVYAATAGGVYKHASGATSWTAASVGTSGAINALVVDSSGTIYAGGMAGVFKSGNGGSNWSAASAGLGSPTVPTVNALLIDASGNVFAGTDNGVYMLGKGGTSWVALYNGMPGVATYALAKDAAGGLYAGTKIGLYKSSTGGQSWATVNGGWAPMTTIYTLLEDAGGYLYAGTSSGLFISSNNGASWLGSNPGTSSEIVTGLVSDAFQYLYVATSTGNLYGSNSHGSYWSTLNQGGASTFGGFTSLFLDTKGVMYAGTKGGVYSTPYAGVAWSNLNAGLSQPPFSSMVQDSQGYLFAAGSMGVYRSNNGGTTWVQLGNSSVASNGFGSSANQIKSLVLSSPNALYAVGKNALFFSTDHGTNWTKVDASPLSTDIVFGTPYGACADPGGNIYFTTSVGVFMYVPGARTWTEIDSNLQAYGSQFNLLTTDVLGNLYVGLVAPNSTTNSVYVTTNQGTTWTNFNNSMFRTAVSGLAFDTKGNLYAATTAQGGNYGNIYMLASGGNSWQLVANNLFSGGNTQLVPDASGNVYALNSLNGIYLGVGSNWVSMSVGTPHEVESLLLAANGNLFASTIDAGVLRFAQTTSTPAAFNVLGQVAGSDSNLQLSVGVQVATADQGQRGNLYVAAQLPSGSLFFLGPNGWSGYSGGTIPAVASNVLLGTNSTTVLDGTIDVGSLAGTVVYVGYGLSQQDMLAGTKYGVAYTLH
jgi:ligand-binding sensor domain-containing protein